MSTKKVQITITIAPADAGGLVVDVSGVPTSGKVGEAYAGQLNVSGGQPPYSFSLSGGNLPDGVTLNSDGSLDGTPTASGSFAFEVEVDDTAV